MTTTFEAVMTALLARLEVAAASLPEAVALRNPAEEEDMPQGATLFALYDGDAGAPLPAVGNEGPFYFEHEAEIDVIAVGDDSAHADALLAAALAALDAALIVDRTLGGRVKGMLWDVGTREIQGRDGAPEKAASVTVSLEYETASRIGA